MSHNGIRVVVVDDDAFTLKCLLHMLIRLGYTSVECQESGARALEIACSPDPPDLILLDLYMPGMDGMELVRKLAENRYAGSILLVSGEDERVIQMAELLIQAHHLAVLGHLRKPVDVADLEEMMARWQPARAPTTAVASYGAADLRAAIQNGELVNYYQPQVVVATGALCGVEALVRWQHPTDGLVFPDRFITLAEESGLINDLTRVVLTDALRQSRAWSGQGLDLKVAVNLSMDSFSSVAFADLISDIVAEAGADPQDIVLEVTESRLLLDQRAPLEILTRLRLKRFRLSIDDFGTGNASLTQLSRISFNELKIDQTFVHNAVRDRTTCAMYTASLELGHQLGMSVIAEGVENRDDWRFVRGTRCDLAQGYFIARPMPGADLVRWKESWDSRRTELVETS